MTPHEAEARAREIVDTFPPTEMRLVIPEQAALATAIAHALLSAAEQARAEEEARHLTTDDIVGAIEAAKTEARREEREKWDRATSALVCPGDQHSLGCQCACDICQLRAAALRQPPA